MAQAGKEQAEQELAIQDSKTGNLIKGIYVFYCQLRLTLHFCIIRDAVGKSGKKDSIECVLYGSFLIPLSVDKYF